MTNSAPKTLYVLGMHRSGTSALAEQLSSMGLALPEDLISGDEGNIRGYFESVRVTRLNERFLESFGSHWRDPSLKHSDISLAAVDSPLLPDVIEFLEQCNSRQQSVILKDPRFCLTLPLWQRASGIIRQHSAVLVAARNPFDVAASLWSRNHIPLMHALQLWVSYYINARKNLLGSAFSYVRLEKLVNNPSIVAALLRDQGIICHSSRENHYFEGLLHHKNVAIQDSRLSFIHSIYANGDLADPSQLPALEYAYHFLGGDLAAKERRHYGTVAMTLDTMVSEKQSQ